MRCKALSQVPRMTCGNNSKLTLKTMNNYYGKHIYVDRGVYTHHGIGIGEGKVIHFSGFEDDLMTGPIEITSLEDFAGEGEVQVKIYDEREYRAGDAVARAYQRLGEEGYDIWDNNCEHFVAWCITGENHSPQVEKAKWYMVLTSMVGMALAIGMTWWLQKENQETEKEP